MKLSLVKVSNDTTTLFVVALFALQLSFPANVTVNVTSPFPTNVIFPLLSIVATLASLEVQVTFPCAFAKFSTANTGASSVIITVSLSNDTTGAAWSAFLIVSVPTFKSAIASQFVPSVTVT